MKSVHKKEQHMAKLDTFLHGRQQVSISVSSWTAEVILTRNLGRQSCINLKQCCLAALCFHLQLSWESLGCPSFGCLFWLIEACVFIGCLNSLLWLSTCCQALKYRVSSVCSQYHQTIRISLVSYYTLQYHRQFLLSSSLIYSTCCKLPRPVAWNDT